MINPNKIICALDFNNISKAVDFVSSIEHDIIFKVGMEFFFNFGVDGIKKLKRYNVDTKIFLDLKLHDIPNTVAMGLSPLLKKIKPFMITLHVSGGKKMLKEAISTVNKETANLSIQRPLVLGVTILTSLNDKDLLEMGHIGSVNEHVEKYAKIANDVRLDGIVCSPLEISIVKKLYGDNLKIITPGIRIKGSIKDDQARFLSAKEAFQRGADFIVIGRPLIRSSDPNELINSIINQHDE